MWKTPDKLIELKGWDKPIIYWTQNGKVGSFNNNICILGGRHIGTDNDHTRSWKDRCEKYSIKYWQFLEEIAPSE